MPVVVDQITALLRREYPGMAVKALEYTIDGKGTVIIKLPDRGIIRDTGTELHYSANSDLGKGLADKLAQSRWGLTGENDGPTVKKSEAESVIIQPIKEGLSR